MFINTIFFIFQDGGRPPSWIFLKFEISTAGPLRMRRFQTNFARRKRNMVLCVTVLNSDEVLLCIVTNMYSKIDDH